MISGLSPVILPEVVCKDCGQKCRTEPRLNAATHSVISVNLYCDTCKLAWEMFPQHVNAQSMRYTAVKE